MTVRVYLTGNVAVEDGDVLVPERRFPARQGRLAFAVLAWEQKRAISMDELADTIWNGAPPSAWQAALRALISKVRTALGDLVTIEHAFGCY
jgi:DNA-binding SARP family transcriptional activator